MIYGGTNRNITASCVSSKLGTCGTCWQTTTTKGVAVSPYTPYSTFVLSSCVNTSSWSISRNIVRFGGSFGITRLYSSLIIVRDETAGNIVVASNQFFYGPPGSIPTGTPRTDTMSVTFQAIAGKQYNFEFVDELIID